MKPKKVTRCLAAPYNPRTIRPESIAGLRASLRIFGDLSGFVLNLRTGHVVCGHQRRAALKDLDLSAAAWGKTYAVELGSDGSRFTSHEAGGELAVPGGARFHVRRVAWPLAFEKAANVAANNPLLQGEFTDRLPEVLAGLDMPEELQLDALVASLGLTHEPEIQARELPPPPPLTWVLIGIPTVRFGEISETVEKIAALNGVLCEVTATNGQDKKDG